MSRILIVEDDSTTQKVYSEKLKLEGFDVEITPSGGGGLTNVMKNTPDLILLDIMLGGDVNGFDVLEELKKNPATEKIPVIVLTNLGSEEKVAKNIGANEYLIKANTSLDDLVKKIKKLVKQFKP